MIFVDSNVFIYAVGRSHPLKAEAQNFFLDSSDEGKRLATSAEVLQEFLHIYLPVARMKTLDAAMELATQGVDLVIPIEPAAVIHAHNLVDNFPGLTARDLLHLSVSQLNKIKDLKTFDRNLQAAFKRV